MTRLLGGLSPHRTAAWRRQAFCVFCAVMLGAMVLLAGCASGGTERAAADAVAPTAIQPIGTDPSVAAIGAIDTSHADDDVATAYDDYKIGPNDLLEITVFGVKELDRTVRVNTTGHVSLPLIGSVAVSGLTASQAERLIADTYGKDYLQDPQVSVFITEFTSKRITVDGAVYKPGIYPMVGDMTLLRALAMAGGRGNLADMETVRIFRAGVPGPDGQPTVETYDVNKIRTGEVSDPVLHGDDLVVVNRNASRVTFRDSLFRDIIDTLNPFSASVSRTAR